MNRRAILAAAAAVLVAAPALARAPVRPRPFVRPAAAAPPASGIRVDHPWIPPASAGRAGAAYASITNLKRAPDTLLRASSPLAARVTLHRMQMSGRIMRMRAIASLPVGAGDTVRLEPGGYHLMLERLKRSLRAGETVPVTLTFAKAGKVQTMFAVQATPSGRGGHM